MNEGMSPADVAAVTNHGCGYGNGWGNNGMFGMEWIFALLILPMLWGGNGPFGRNGCQGEPVTESGLCNAMNANNLENAVGRLSDTVQAGQRQTDNAVCNLGYQALNLANQTQRDMCTGFTGVVSAINAAAAQQAQCCCETKQMLMENRYLAERNAANSDANVTAQIQSVKDMLCAQEAARKDARIWQLELNQAMCGVPRFQPGTVYGAVPANPFFGSWGNCCNNGCGGNI